MASFDENGKYIKTNWKAGDKITATKLNKIEESIEAVNDNDISRHVEADARLDALEAKDVAHDKELTNIKNTIADNKAAAELGDYDINSRMTFLEEELNEGIEEVHNVAETVDGKIATAEASMTTQVNQGKADMEAMVAEVEADLEGLHAKDEELSTQLEQNKNELDVERKRIDAFTTLSEGSTTGDAELIDGRIGYDNIIYGNIGDSIRTQIKNTNEKIDNRIKQSINLLDNSKWIDGYYVYQEVNDGVKTLGKTANNDFCYIEIPVKGGTTYTISNYAFQIVFCGYENNNLVVRSATGNGQTNDEPTIITTYETDTTIFINKKKSQKFVMLVEGEECPDYFIEYGNEVLKDINNPLEWHVGEGKDFEGFTECIRFLKDDEREKTIYIHQGDYDIFNELGGSSYAQSFTVDDTNNWADIVDWIPPNTNIIGIGKVRLIYTPLQENTNEYASRIFSTINTRGTCTIDNVEIYCKNGRYCIHDETGDDETFTGAIKKFKNLKCVHYASDDSVATMHQCVGGGLHKSMFIEYDNCYFESQHPKYGNTFSYHNSNSLIEMKDSSRINVKNCIFIKNENNPNEIIRFGNCNTTLTDIKVNISSSYIGGDLLVTNEFSSDSLINAFNVTLLHCNDITTSINATNNQYNVKIYK